MTIIVNQIKIFMDSKYTSHYCCRDCVQSYDVKCEIITKFSTQVSSGVQSKKHNVLSQILNAIKCSFWTYNACDVFGLAENHFFIYMSPTLTPRQSFTAVKRRISIFLEKELERLKTSHR